MTVVEEIVELVDELGDVEQQVVLQLVTRLQMGQQKYGEITTTDTRDMGQEATEEIIDALFYSALKLLGMGRDRTL